ncbi:MAG: polysaccharide biosynthesis protein [Ignavibacteria bacterium]|nr:polysaccharide biosynthesis protein [Ignavibacteria bacterium]
MLSGIIKIIKENDFFCKLIPENGRSRNVIKHIAGSFFVKIGSAAVGLILVPLTISYVNTVTYGIWLTLSSIVLWISYFDIGIGNGLRNKFAELKASESNIIIKKYISTAYALFIILFLCIWLAVFLLSENISWAAILNAPSYMNNELKISGLIITGFFCLQMVLKVITTVLTADQKPAFASFIDFIGQFLILASIFVLTLYTKGSILYLATAAGLMPVLVLLGSTIILFKSRYNLYIPSFRMIDFSCARDIMGLGIKFFLIQISALIIYQTSNIIITHISGPEDVTVYNIAFKYFSLSSMLFLILITPFWSAFTEAYYKKEYKWMKSALKKLRQIFYLFIILITVMLVISPYFYEIWIGNKIHIGISISILMSFLFLLMIWNNLHSYILNGTGRIKLQLYVAVAGSAVFIPLAVLLGRFYGMQGVIAASIIVNLVSAFYSPFQVNLIVGNRAKGIWNS